MNPLVIVRAEAEMKLIRTGSDTSSSRNPSFRRPRINECTPTANTVATIIAVGP